MIDPLSALAIIKSGISAGKQIHSMSKEVAAFFDSVDGVRKEHSKKKNSIFASANEEALDTWTHMQNAKQAEEELREFITNTKGYSAYQDLLKIRRQIALERKEMERRVERERQERQEMILAIGAFITVLASVLSVGLALLHQRGII